MFDVKLSIKRDEPIVGVRTTENRGFSPEELAEQCVSKIISVSSEAHPGIRDQATAFSRQIEKLVAHYMRQAIHSDRTTVYTALDQAGHKELAELIRRL